MNQKSSIDLLSLAGAELVSIEKNGKKVNCVVVPVAYNCISVTANKETGVPNHAYLNMREWEVSQKFREACIRNHEGEDDYLPPSHQISVAYTEEFTNLARSSAEKRLRGDAEFMAKNPTDEDIKREAAYAVSNKARIGYVTPLKRQEPAAYTGTAPAASVQGAYVPPTGEAQPEDDLPF